MSAKAWDGVKIPEKEWDSTPPERREPYVEFIRKGGFVYATNEKDGEPPVVEGVKG